MNEPESFQVDDWLAELASQRRQSPHTVAAYRRDLEKLRTQAGETPLNALQAHHIRRFIAQLHGGGLSGRSLARALSAWRGYYHWLGKRGEVAANPCEGIRPPKSPKLLPAALPVDETMRLLESAPSPPTPLPHAGEGSVASRNAADTNTDDPRLSVRDQAIFELFYSSGLRLAELAALDGDAFDMAINEGEVRVLGKRSKLRIVPVGGQARTALAAWREIRDELAKPDEKALFVSRRGTRLTHRAIEERLKQRAIRQGLPVHVHPHMLRHSFASHVLQSSGDLRAVQEMLGHASIASTQVYTHLDFQHLAKVYDAAHPRAKRKS